MLRPMKQLALSALTHPACGAALRPLMRGRAAIFMLHRFAQPEAGIEGHDPSQLRATLARFRMLAKAGRLDLSDLE